MSKITAYTALASADAADVLPIVDVDDTTMASSGTTKKITAGNLLQGVAVPPSGDTSGATDTAAINAIAQAGKAALLQAGTYYVTHLLPDSYGGIIGVGPATVLQAVSGTTGYMIALKTPASTQQVYVRDVKLIPNVSGLGGIQLDNTGFSQAIPFDPLHRLQNILIVQAGADAFHFDNNQRELRCENCITYDSVGYGFYLGNGPSSSGNGVTDGHFTDCTSGQAQSHGWYVLGSNNTFTSCKGFGSGNTQPGNTWGTTQCNWYISGCAWNVFSACSAQQAALHGFHMVSCTDSAIVGCEADSNSAGTGVSTGVGINLDSNLRCAIIGNVGNQNASPGNQKYGIQVAGTQTSTWIMGNAVSGGTDTFGYVSGGGYLLFDKGIFDLTNIYETRFGSPELYSGGPAAVSNSSTIGFSNGEGTYELTATGNVTGLIMGAGTFPGQIIIIVNESAFTMTFAALATSHMQAGTSEVIAAGTARKYVWANSGWYHLV